MLSVGGGENLKFGEEQLPNDAPDVSFINF